MENSQIYTNDGIERILLSGTYNGYAFSIQTNGYYPTVYVQYAAPNSMSDFFNSDLTDLCNIYVPAHAKRYGLIDDYVWVGMAFCEEEDYVCGGEQAHKGVLHGNLWELEHFARTIIDEQMKGYNYES